MAHHRDSNVPLQLDAAAIAQFEGEDDIVKMNQRIASLTQQIAGEPEVHKHLTIERSRLYNKKAKRLQAWKADFVRKWWDTSYDEYVAGNDFSERDTTPLFEIHKKYLPERSRLSENIFKETTLDSDVGRQCLEDMVSLCKSTERVVYYPRMSPKEGRCPICSRRMAEYVV